jgi:type IV pilus assembly protein PilC
MVFSGQLPLASLIEFCRALRHNLGAGLSLRDVFRQQARQGSRAIRPVAERIRQVIEQGDDLETALKQESKAFPPLFVALVSVGERSGNLPEVFKELEKYFATQLRLWRQFVAMSIWPAFQFFAAIFTIAGMILIIGLLSSPGAKEFQFDPTGFGVGPTAALRFLLIVFGLLASLVAAYFVVTRTLKQKAAVHRLLLRLPAVGPCLESLALMRLSLALHLTMDTSLPVADALDRSLKATGNAAYMACSEAAQDAVRRGDSMSEALAVGGILPTRFLNILATAEVGGQIPEMMRHQAEFYEEEAALRLTVLTRAAGYAVWLFVAILIIWLIFRMALSYIGLINSLSGP